MQLACLPLSEQIKQHIRFSGSNSLTSGQLAALMEWEPDELEEVLRNEPSIAGQFKIVQTLIELEVSLVEGENT